MNQKRTVKVLYLMMLNMLTGFIGIDEKIGRRIGRGFEGKISRREC